MAVWVRTYLGGLECFWENAVEDGTGGTRRVGGLVGVFNLSEDFVFAQHLGMEAGGDLDQMVDGSRSGGEGAHLAKLGRRDALVGAEAAGECFDGVV